jgi:hypothetical protein
MKQRTTDNGQRTKGMWRFRGSPHYLDQQAKRLGITQVLADRARHNPEIYRVSVLLAQLSERYHRVRKENGKAVFFTTELAQIKGTLEQCELELQKLHMLASAANAMLDEAWQAFGYETPQRLFKVTCDLDSPGLGSDGHDVGNGSFDPIESPFPLGDGTVGIPDDEPQVFAQSL